MTAFALLLLITVQDTPQRHVTAHIALRNGDIYVASVDSGGTRRVQVVAEALTVDTILKRPRGGRWSYNPSTAVALAALIMSVPAPVGELPVPIDAGHISKLTVRCDSGCTLTITNRTPSGVIRAGSWTSSPRLPLEVVRGLADALARAARQDSPDVFTYSAR